MKVDIKRLQEFNPCAIGLDYFLENKLKDIDFKEGSTIEVETQSEFNFIKWFLEKTKNQIRVKSLKFKRSDGSWEKFEYNDQGLKTRYESSNGYWTKFEYNSQGLKTRCEDSNGYWSKFEYNDQGLKTRYENSDGSWFNYEYNPQGLKTREECLDGSWFNYEYNEQGDLVSIDYIGKKLIKSTIKTK